MPLVIGLMSGTSLDGVDVSLVDINNEKINEAAFESFEISKELKNKILDCCDIKKSNVAMLCSLNVELGRFFGLCVNRFLELKKIDYRDIFCIGSHGQTVYHHTKDEGDLFRSTLQIGEPAEIAYITKIPVVSSFRAKDMAAGGQGAPLVPYSEYLIYSSKEKSRALQNIGGIGNVTYLKRYGKLDEVFAFDTGPGNMIIDSLMRNLFDKPYDKNGEAALCGKPIDELINRWMSMEYISLEPPKSTGRELFGEQFVRSILDGAAYKSEDLVHTATLFTAKSIAYNYKKFIIDKGNPIDEVIVSGGGSHNKTLLKMLENELSGIKVFIQEDIGFSSDAKEATAFAVLANESMNRRFGNAKSATGASRAVVLGSITWPE